MGRWKLLERGVIFRQSAVNVGGPEDGAGHPGEEGFISASELDAGDSYARRHHMYGHDKTFHLIEDCPGHGQQEGPVPDSPWPGLSSSAVGLRRGRIRFPLCAAPAHQLPQFRNFWQQHVGARREKRVIREL
jgi:hypothetical protein